VRPAAHQARRQALELRELHLQLAFGGLRALREDVQDEIGAVHHDAPELLLQVALLRRRERVVEDDGGGIQLGGEARDLLDLAGAGVELGVGAAAPAAHHGVARHARAFHQALDLFYAFVVAVVAEIQTNDERSTRIGDWGEGFRLPFGQPTPLPSPLRG